MFKKLHPFSTNKSVSFNKKGRYYKNSAKANFQKQVNAEMSRYKSEIFAFEAEFSPYEHFLVGKVYMFMPKDLLITKRGTISRKSFDVNNHKVFTDTIFRAFLELDDSQLISEEPLKLLSPDDDYHMGYKLEIHSLDELEGMSKNAWAALYQ